jgi:hypothetical protein
MSRIISVSTLLLLFNLILFYLNSYSPSMLAGPATRAGAARRGPCGPAVGRRGGGGGRGDIMIVARVLFSLTVSSNFPPDGACLAAPSDRHPSQPG